MDREDDAAQEVEAVTRRGVTERFGRYRSLGRIGRGGMADVFLAVGRGPAGFNKLVVIKRLRDTVASDDAFREMFLDEARLAARLNHPNVVQTYEVFEDAGAFFITMEHLEGQPLGRIERECNKRGMRLKPQFCARIVSDALCGLHYAHEVRDYDGAPLNIVHRDVSPQNIFVTYDGQVKVVDFGIAKAELSQTKTQAGFFKGKAAYMAPEQLEGSEIDRRVDVFTAGIVLWEMLVGQRLMAAESTAKTLMRLLKEPIPHVTELVAGIDPELDRIVTRALQRDPAARYQTAGEMRNALDHYLVESGHFVRQEDLGRIVGELFRDARASMRQAISEHLAHASEFPPSVSSGTMQVASEVHLAAQTPSLDPLQPASMSGISVSRTLTSAQPLVPPSTGIVSVSPPSKDFRLPSAVMGAIAIALLALAFAIVERTRMPTIAVPAPASTQGLAPAPLATHATPPLPASVEATPAEAPHPDPAAALPATNAPAVAAPIRAAQPVFISRPGRAPAPEPRPTIAATRSAPSNPINSPAPEASPPAAPATPPAEGPAAHATSGPPASSPPPASPAPTKEGRKFRTSL